MPSTLQGIQPRGSSLVVALDASDAGPDGCGC